jgi:hypothetical protein
MTSQRPERESEDRLMNAPFPVLKLGSRLKSQVGPTEIIVTRPGSGAVKLACGGHPMIDIKAQGADDVAPEPGLDGETLIGKRYTSPADEAFEVIVTRAGAGTLADGRVPLAMRESKKLPASD